MFAIVTDSSANLDYKALSLENITVAPFIYSMNGEEHSCPPVNGFDGAAYYDAMRNGAVVVTSQVTPHVFKEKWEISGECNLAVQSRLRISIFTFLQVLACSQCHIPAFLLIEI